MSFAIRAATEKRFRDARYDRRLRRMEVLQTDENGKPVGIIAHDGTTRRIGSRGTEGALREACRQVKVSLVPVITPKAAPGDRERAELLLNAIALGVTVDSLQASRQGVDGALESIGHREAKRRYAIRSDDICERVPGGSMRQ